MTQASQLSAPVHGLSNGARKILDVAKQLFAEKGFDAISINQIAQQAGVSKANVFHHFTSKDALYLAVLKAACEETVGSLAEAHSSGNAGEDLWEFFSSHLAAMLANQASAKLILREIVESKNEREQTLAEHVFAEYFTRLVGMVSDGQTQGLLRKDFDPALLAFLMLGANVFFFENYTVTAHLVEGGFARTPDSYSRDVFRLLLQGALVNPETGFQFREA
ncbi:MAG: TetR/AcrR family transcriptional regulator [Deltaproteobacteria bacterium]|nr:MAG: TetR/AcrR family transcriptional regulator [Gammaproteobacteria bacterium]RLB68586.1 MAG: TetR/AcrR family transcriptional regulator [Deltaproteobacteria bacterium]